MYAVLYVSYDYHRFEQFIGVTEAYCPETLADYFKLNKNREVVLNPTNKQLDRYQTEEISHYEVIELDCNGVPAYNPELEEELGCIINTFSKAKLQESITFNKHICEMIENKLIEIKKELEKR